MVCTTPFLRRIGNRSIVAATKNSSNNKRKQDTFLKNDVIWEPYKMRDQCECKNSSDSLCTFYKIETEYVQFWNQISRHLLAGKLVSYLAVSNLGTRSACIHPQSANAALAGDDRKLWKAMSNRFCWSRQVCRFLVTTTPFPSQTHGAFSLDCGHYHCTVLYCTVMYYAPLYFTVL